MSPPLHIQRDIADYTYFVTMTVLDWIDIFTDQKYFQILTDSFKYCMEKKGLVLYEYVFMTNHIHFIARTKEENQDLSKVIRDFKSFTTREILNQLENDNRKYILELLGKSEAKHKENKYQVWQRDNCPKGIESNEFLAQKTNYIWHNPVRKGYVHDAEDWLYGSAKQKMLGLDPSDERVVLPCSEFEA